MVCKLRKDFANLKTFLQSQFLTFLCLTMQISLGYLHSLLHRTTKTCKRNFDMKHVHQSVVEYDIRLYQGLGYFKSTWNSKRLSKQVIMVGIWDVIILLWLLSVAFCKIIRALKSHMTCYNLKKYSFFTNLRNL